MADLSRFIGVSNPRAERHPHSSLHTRANC